MARPRDDHKEAALLDAALTEIALIGLSGLSVDAVARRARVAPSTIYTYFKGKEALIDALYRSVKLGFSRTVFTSATGPVRPAIEAACEAYLAYCRRSAAELIFLEQLEASPARTEQVSSITARAMKPLVDLLDRGKVEGIVKDIDNDTLIAVLSGALQAAARQSPDDVPERLERRSREVVGMCWDAIAR